MNRPSTPLLNFIRETIKRQGLTTAELAEKTGIDRSTLKKRLSGSDALTVDDLVALSGALNLQQGLPDIPEPTLTLNAAPDDDALDPVGNLPKQVLRMGYTLGIDLFVTLDSTQLEDSGIPDSVLSRFKELLPVRLDARYHRHNKPVFGDRAFECVLSFDRLYTCSIPWTSLRQVNFILPIEQPEPEPVVAPTPRAPFLRVVK